MSRTISRLLPWFGANTATAKAVGTQMGKPKWACVLFAGGCSELPFIQCRQGVANDLHRHVINLARMIADPMGKTNLVAKLNQTLFHPDELRQAQGICKLMEDAGGDGLFGAKRTTHVSAFDWAYSYFITAWMCRGGNAGTDGEFNAGLSTRFNGNGGGSNVRFRSATAALEEWQKECMRWEWECLDCFEMLEKITDPVVGCPVYGEDKAIYADAPWVEAGEGYRHKFNEHDHVRLADCLGRYEKTRIVIRYGDHPLIRKLYPESKWNIVPQCTRDQNNGKVNELLILNGRSYT